MPTLCTADVEAGALGGLLREGLAEALPAADTRSSSWRVPRWYTAAILCLFFVVVLAWWGAQKPAAAAANVAGLDHFHSKAVVKLESGAKRVRSVLRIEGDVGYLVTRKMLSRGTTPSETWQCADRALHLFAAVVTEHPWLQKEMDKVELDAFKARFTSAMGETCEKDPLIDPTKWLQQAQRGLEEQKPLMTRALAFSVNSARLGFKVKMEEWMVYQSKASFRLRLGRSAELPLHAKVSKPTRVRRGTLPSSFDSAERWPLCKEQILRIRDQGACGSCWAQSCTYVMDARACIATDANFTGGDAALSPAFMTSCAARDGYPGDGCQGGWEFNCFVYVDRSGTPGTVSEKCNPYFREATQAPSCPSACDGRYPRTLAQDGFKFTHISNYKLYLPADAAAHEAAKWAIYNGGPISHGIYASGSFMGYTGGIFNECFGDEANHAVYAYGWFEGGYYSKNSWGKSWGEQGRMRIASCTATDFTVPGDFRAGESHIPYPLA